MALIEDDLDWGDIDPIDLIEHIAATNEWMFDRLEDDRIALAVEGQWRTYSVTMAWSQSDETLRLLCTFEMEPPAHREGQLYEAINHANEMCWAGNFTWWSEQRMMVYRYGLILAGEQFLTPEQVDMMIGSAIAACERFYPAFQLVTWADRSPVEAMGIAIAEAHGTA